MKKMRMFYSVVIFALLSMSVVMFSCTAQAGEVPDGFIGIPWGASKAQIIKTMNERGCQQRTSEQSNELVFLNGDFAGVPCYSLSFYLIGNSFYSGWAQGCQWSPYHGVTQGCFKWVIKMLSEKYGSPQIREPSKVEGKDVRGWAECKKSGYPTDYAQWDFVDSRSDKYSISITLDVSFLVDMTEKEQPCRIDFYVIYSADSLGKRLEKKNY
ncbi:MAG: hypothetical protein KKE71_04025 [Nanoarchaeota archaeon]|nr:hypothetical protein [Nanoarchaeota archaeon]